MADLHLVLGCFGRQDDGFVSCSATENTILRLNDQIHNYNEVMDYLDNCRLFDRPTFEFNSVRHIVNYLQERFDQVHKKLWSENKFKTYQSFVINHRNCGVYLRLLPIEEKAPEPEKIDVKTSLRIIK